MATTRILDSDRGLLQELAAQTGKPHQQLIHEALAAFHRDLLLDDINAAFASLKRDQSAWQEQQLERAVWDRATADGIAADGVAADSIHEVGAASYRASGE